MINLLNKRYIFFGVSLFVIPAGIIIIAIWGLPLAIDFVGGTLLEISFDSGTNPQPSEVVILYNKLGVFDVQVQTTGQESLIIRSPVLKDSDRELVIDRMEEEFNDSVTILRFDTVGPTIGREVTNSAALAVLVAAIAVVIYITFAFRGIKNAMRYGICAIIATIHDVLIIISLSAIGGHFFGWQIDSLYLTAVLTVIGFSTQDKIVVFDRVRENSSIFHKLEYEKLVNHSVVQTLQRSINTQLMTSEFLLLALALLGGVTLRQFAIVLLVGLASGTYSSIFIAAPILVVWHNKEWQTWFRRKETSAA